MADVVHLHVGAPKTGTTYLQGRLHHNREALARHGVHYPSGLRQDMFVGALDLIDRHPTVRAPDLAARVGRETADFKKDVSKLKELGLTESLAIGYLLSPRGEAVVDAGPGGCETHDAFAGHEAVGVEHEHMLVMAAPARDEIGDVAGLAVMVLRPVAIVEAGVRAQALPQGEVGSLLGDPGVRVRGV